MELTIEDIKNKFDKLPEDLKWAIMGAKIDEKLMQIGSTHGLNIRQIGQLSLETHAVMMGFLHPDQFASSIKASLGLDDEKVKLITLSVNEKIIKGVREKLVELRGGSMPVPDDVPEKRLPKEENIIQETNTTTEQNKEENLEEKIREEDKKITNGIITNKLISTVVSNKSKTEYSPNKEIMNTNTETKKVDPYRMPIE